MHDVHEAGGVSAIIKELVDLGGAIHPDRITVTGKTIRENVADAKLIIQMLSIQKKILIAQLVDFPCCLEISHQKEQPSKLVV